MGGTPSDVAKHLGQFINILKLTRSEKFLFFNEGAVTKAFKWADFVHKTMSSGKISEEEKGHLISILSPVGIHQLDENIAIIVKDPLRALAIAFLSSPLLAQTKDVLSMTISGLIERMGKDAALDLCTDIMYRGYQSKKELIDTINGIHHEDVSSTSYSSSCTWSEEEDIFTISLINAIIRYYERNKLSSDNSSMKSVTDLLFDKANKDDYVFLLLIRACILPMSRYVSSKLENMGRLETCISCMTVSAYIGTRNLLYFFLRAFVSYTMIYA